MIDEPALPNDREGWEAYLQAVRAALLKFPGNEELLALEERALAILENA